jgi:outer membrane PBP1 activator LpoA protein
VAHSLLVTTRVVVFKKKRISMQSPKNMTNEYGSEQIQSIPNKQQAMKLHRKRLSKETLLGNKGYNHNKKICKTKTNLRHGAPVACHIKFYYKQGNDNSNINLKSKRITRIESQTKKKH